MDYAVLKYRIISNPDYKFAHGSFTDSMGKYFGGEVIGDEKPVIEKQKDASVVVHFYDAILAEDGIAYLIADGLLVEEIK